MLEWASATFAPMRLTWKALPPLGRRERAQGLTQDGAAGVEIVGRAGRLHQAAVITPISAAYTPLLVRALAIVAAQPEAQADAWLATALRDLSAARRKVVRRRFGPCACEAKVTTAGVFTLVVRYGAA